MAVKAKETETIGMRIKSHFKNLGWLAEQIGISQGQLSKKIHGTKPWKQEEIDIINKVLDTDFKL
jgi:hypothetical protein